MHFHLLSCWGWKKNHLHSTTPHQHHCRAMVIWGEEKIITNFIHHAEMALDRAQKTSFKCKIQIPGLKLHHQGTSNHHWGILKHKTMLEYLTHHPPNYLCYLNYVSSVHLLCTLKKNGVRDPRCFCEFIHYTSLAKYAQGKTTYACIWMQDEKPPNLQPGFSAACLQLRFPIHRKQPS